MELYKRTPKQQQLQICEQSGATKGATGASDTKRAVWSDERCDRGERKSKFFIYFACLNMLKCVNIPFFRTNRALPELCRARPFFIIIFPVICQDSSVYGLHLDKYQNCTLNSTTSLGILNCLAFC